MKDKFIGIVKGIELLKADAIEEFSENAFSNGDKT